MTHETLKVASRDGVCRITFNRPQQGNAINAKMIDEFADVLGQCADERGVAGQPVSVVVIEGGHDVFCAGGDFDAVSESGSAGDPEPLYDVWSSLAEGPFVSISLIKGRVNAGGVGFAAACDIAIADAGATFALSELLFGLFPACVLPFLIKRVGRQSAHYMTLMTKPVSASEAKASGLIDVLTNDPEAALRQHLARLRHLDKRAIARYKSYLASCSGDPRTDKASALAANRAIFSNRQVLAGIRRYVTELKFPWED